MAKPKKRRTPQSGHPCVTWGSNGKWIASCYYGQAGARWFYLGHFWPDELDAAIAAVEHRLTRPTP